MALSAISLLALAVILAALAVAWSRRFLASGALLVSNIVIYVMTAFGPTVKQPCGPPGLGAVCERAVIHEELSLHSALLRDGEPLAFLQLLSSMFVHADFFHLLGNAIVLLVFALPFEERVGHRRFLGIYLLTGLVAALAQLGTYWSVDMQLMGASGAVFGIIGAFAATYPNLVVPVPVPVLIIMIFVRMRVWIGGAILGGLQFLYLAIASPFDNTAYMAHIGGLVAGVAIAFAYLRRQRTEAPQPVRIQFGALEPFAVDEGTRAALQQMRNNRDEPAVFQAWMERFFRSARCPTCTHPVMPRTDGKVVCTHGHGFDVRRPNDG